MRYKSLSHKHLLIALHDSLRAHYQRVYVRTVYGPWSPIPHTLYCPVSHGSETETSPHVILRMETQDCNSLSSYQSHRALFAAAEEPREARDQPRRLGLSPRGRTIVTNFQ